MNVYRIHTTIEILTNSGKLMIYVCDCTQYKYRQLENKEKV